MQNKYLNLAGRITLLKSTFFSLPIHFMQVVVLPQNLLNQLNKEARKFLWNDTKEKKKIRLIGLNTLAKPLIEGGLNISDPKNRNTTLADSLAWRCFVSNTSMLWARPIRTRYNISKYPRREQSKNESQTMQCLGIGCELCIKGLCKQFGNGENIDF